MESARGPGSESVRTIPTAIAATAATLVALAGRAAQQCAGDHEWNEETANGPSRDRGGSRDATQVGP